MSTETATWLGYRVTGLKFQPYDEESMLRHDTQHVAISFIYGGRLGQNNMWRPITVELVGTVSGVDGVEKVVFRQLAPCDVANGNRPSPERYIVYVLGSDGPHFVAVYESNQPYEGQLTPVLDGIARVELE